MGMLGMMGVESVESSSRQNAMKNNIDRGVAGRSMMAKRARGGVAVPTRQRPALETLRGGGRLSRLDAVFEDAQRGRNRKQGYARKMGRETSDD
jgi:hypothetical protein